MEEEGTTAEEQEQEAVGGGQGGNKWGRGDVQRMGKAYWGRRRR